MRALAHADGRGAREPGRTAHERPERRRGHALAARCAVDVDPLGEDVVDAVGLQALGDRRLGGARQAVVMSLRGGVAAHDPSPGDLGPLASRGSAVDLGRHVSDDG